MPFSVVGLVNVGDVLYSASPTMGSAVRIEPNATTPTVTTFSPAGMSSAGSFGLVAADGFVYFLPNTGPTASTITRYDSRHSFTDAAAWETFSLGAVSPVARGFWGGSFDGTYLWLAPEFYGAAGNVALRYDTRLPFGAATSWSSVTLTSAGAIGSISHQSNTYFMMHGSSGGENTRVTKVDQSLVQESFDLMQLSPTLEANTFGGAFDSRYVYAIGKDIARYDTLAPFGSTSSWSYVAPRFPTMVVAFGTYLGGFDGRFVYFPNRENLGRYIGRYDTTAPFTLADGFEFVNLDTVGLSAMSVSGVTFDGRDLYFVGHRLYRFRAVPNGVPGSASISFF